MITEQQAGLQLERLAGLDFFPSGKEKAAALKELRLALQAADTPAIAKLVVDEWLAGSESCPKPYDLRVACHRENERNETSPALKKYEEWKKMAAQKIGGDGFEDLFAARQAELKADPRLRQFHQDAGGHYYRTPTELSVKLTEGIQHYPALEEVPEK